MVGLFWSVGVAGRLVVTGHEFWGLFVIVVLSLFMGVWWCV